MIATTMPLSSTDRGSLVHDLALVPEGFRAILQGYFLPARLVGIVGLCVPAVTRCYLMSFHRWSVSIASSTIDYEPIRDG
jgi:hypothetical protein